MDEDAGFFLVGDAESDRLPTFDLEVMGRGIENEIGVRLGFKRIKRTILQGQKGPAILAGGDGVNQFVIDPTDLECGVGNALRAVIRIDLDKFDAADGIIIKTKGLRVIGVDGTGCPGRW